MAKDKARKHRPQELRIAREPVPVLRENAALERRARARDPRFDRAYGHFNSDLYGKSYAFLADLQSAEAKELREALSKERDPRRADSIRKVLDRRASLAAAAARNAERQEALREWRTRESAMVAEGKRAWHLKRRDVDALVLQQKVSKSTPEQLERMAEKRAKKVAGRQKRRLPFSL